MKLFNLIIELLPGAKHVFIPRVTAISYELNKMGLDIQILIDRQERRQIELEKMLKDLKEIKDFLKSHKFN